MHSRVALFVFKADVARCVSIVFGSFIKNGGGRDLGREKYGGGSSVMGGPSKFHRHGSMDTVQTDTSQVETIPINSKLVSCVLCTKSFKGYLKGLKVPNPEELKSTQSCYYIMRLLHTCLLHFPNVHSCCGVFAFVFELQ